MDPISLSLILLFSSLGYIYYTWAVVACLDDISYDIDRKKRERQSVRKWKLRKLQKEYRTGASRVLEDHALLPIDVKNLIMYYYDSISCSR